MLSDLCALSDGAGKDGAYKGKPVGSSVIIRPEEDLQPTPLTNGMPSPSSTSLPPQHKGSDSDDDDFLPGSEDGASSSDETTLESDDVISGEELRPVDILHDEQMYPESRRKAGPKRKVNHATTGQFDFTSATISLF